MNKGLVAGDACSGLSHRSEPATEDRVHPSNIGVSDAIERGSWVDSSALTAKQSSDTKNLAQQYGTSLESQVFKKSLSASTPQLLAEKYSSKRSTQRGAGEPSAKVSLPDDLNSGSKSSLTTLAEQNEVIVHDSVPPCLYRHDPSRPLLSIAASSDDEKKGQSETSFPTTGEFANDEQTAKVATNVGRCREDASSPSSDALASVETNAIVQMKELRTDDHAAKRSKNEATLEELMTIMADDDNIGFEDDFLNGSEFDNHAAALSKILLDAQTIIPERDDQNDDESSDVLPNSSFEFSTAQFSARIDSCAHLSAATGDYDDDDASKAGRGRRKALRVRKMSEILEIKDENCSPNRPHPALETPLLYFFLRRAPWLFDRIKVLYAFRWRLSYPLQRNVPFSRTMRKAGIHATWGELMILIPFFAAIFAGILYSTAFPSVLVTGKIVRFAVIASLMFAQRNSLVTLLLGMPFDRAIFYHKLAGQVTGATSLLHVAAFYTDPQYGRMHDADSLGGAVTGHINISGSALVLLIAGITVSSLPLFRRRMFEVFYCLHFVFVAGMIACTFFHSGMLIPIIAFLSWGVDLFIRSIVMARTRYPRKATLLAISDTVIQVSFPKTAAFAYNPGQFVYLAIPEISWLQWHPFSISSSPKQRVVTLHIRTAGNWTRALFDLCKTKTEVSILLEGPYGNLSVDVMGNRKYKSMLLLSGGIGSM